MGRHQGVGGAAAGGAGARAEGAAPRRGGDRLRPWRRGSRGGGGGEEDPWSPAGGPQQPPARQAAGGPPSRRVQLSRGGRGGRSALNSVLKKKAPKTTQKRGRLLCFPCESLRSLLSSAGVKVCALGDPCVCARSFPWFSPGGALP